MTARDHNRLLAIFYFIMAGLQLLGGVFIALIYGILGGAALSTARGDEERVVGGIFLGLAVIVGLVMAAIGGFTLLTGFKVFKEKPIGRVLGIIISIPVLFSVPLGTALGIYGLWFFFGDVGKNFYANLAGSPGPPPPPQPNSWR